MFYSAYLIIEAGLTAAFLYCVLFLPPNVYTNICASTLLALAVLCCLNGIKDLVSGVREKYDIVTNRIMSSRLSQSLNKKALSKEDLGAASDGSYLAMLSRALIQALQCVAGYTAIITLLTRLPIYVFPYAHKVSFWPISLALRESLSSVFAKVQNFALDLIGAKHHTNILTGHKSAMSTFRDASKDYMRTNAPWLTSFWTTLRSTKIGTMIGTMIETQPRAYLIKYQNIVRPIWRDQDFRTVWIIVWFICAIGVILSHRIFIRKQSFSHLLALLSGALVAGFLNENSILRDIQNAESAAYGTTNILRLESIAYRLGLLDMSCNCVEKSLATLAVTTWVIIILITMALPSVEPQKPSERTQQPKVPIVITDHCSNITRSAYGKDKICEMAGRKISAEENWRGKNLGRSNSGFARVTRK